MPNKQFLTRRAKPTRRDALRLIALGSAAALVAPSLSCAPTVEKQSRNTLLPPAGEAGYGLPELPYAYDALVPSIDEMTMTLHHTKHHQAYVNGLNAALEKYPELYKQPLEELLHDLEAVPEDIRTAVRNHGGGHFNHSLFWHMMSPDGGNDPAGVLADAMFRDFGSLGSFKDAFNVAAMGVFGSGWAWLASDSTGTLSVMTTPNQDTPLAVGLSPVLGIDVWEHAYYLEYQNRRVEYVSAFWDVVNWSRCADLYQSALG